MHPHVMLTTLRNASRALHPQTYIPYTHQNLSILSILLAHGFLSSVTLGSSQNPHPRAFASAPRPAQMLVANLKYRGDRSVIGVLDSVSTPSRPFEVTRDELGRLLRGQRIRGVRGVLLGELVIVKRKDNYYEGRDALRMGEGGEVLVRVGTE